MPRSLSSTSIRPASSSSLQRLSSSACLNIGENERSTHILAWSANNSSILPFVLSKSRSSARRSSSRSFPSSSSFSTRSFNLAKSS